MVQPDIVYKESILMALLKRDPVDSLEFLQREIAFIKEGLSGLPDEKGSADGLRVVRGKLFRRLKAIDAAYTTLITEDSDRVTWAARMRDALAALNTLDKNLVFVGKRQWNWDEVIPAVAVLTAIVQGGESTVELNQLQAA